MIAELAVIRVDRRFAPSFTLKVEKAQELLRFVVIQLYLARRVLRS